MEIPRDQFERKGKKKFCNMVMEESPATEESKAPMETRAMNTRSGRECTKDPNA